MPYNRQVQVALAIHLEMYNFIKHESFHLIKKIMILKSVWIKQESGDGLHFFQRLFDF